MYKVELTEQKARKQKGWFGRIKHIVSPIKHEIVFYDSDRNLPNKRFNKFNKYLFISMDVGSSIEDYDRKQSRATKYLIAKEYEAAIQELNNARQCFFSAMSEYSPKGLALATMVHSIDGVIYKSYDSGTLEEILNKLDDIGFTKAMEDETVDYLKKK